MARRAIVAATANPGKLKEFRSLLGGLPLDLLSLDAGPAIAFPEEGTDYAVNAVAKAEAVAQQWGEWAVADDSGLEVEALQGAPGPLSARFGGPGLDDAGRVAHLLDALVGGPPPPWTARFVCVAAWAEPGGGGAVARGECPGRIVARGRGARGFGYDPVFQPDGFDATMAELGPSVKDRISHRGRAFARLRETLLAHLPGSGKGVRS